jgi:hypothetical protein
MREGSHVLREVGLDKKESSVERGEGEERGAIRELNSSEILEIGADTEEGGSKGEVRTY